MKDFKKKLLPIILILGFFLRLIVILNNGHGPSYDSPASSDEVNYRELARNIYENKIYASWSEGFFTRSMRAPAYPAILAFANFADFSWGPLILNLILDTGNIFLVYVFAGLFFGKRVALLSGSLYAVFAPSFIYLRFGTTEIFAVFLLLSFLISLFSYEKISSLDFYALVIFYTLLTHTRPSFLPLIPLLIIVIFLKLRKNSSPLKEKIFTSVLPSLFIMLLCVPWTLRNYYIQKTFVPIIVIPAWHAVESSSLDLSLSADKVMDFIYAPERNGWNEGRYFDEAQRQYRSMLIKEPLKIFAYGVYRIFKAWCFPDFWKRIFLPQAYFNPVVVYGGISLFLPDFEGVVYFLLISIVFAIFAKKEDLEKLIKVFFVEKLWILLLLFSYIAVHIFAIPFPQYRFIVEPVFAIFAIYLIMRIFNLDKANEEVIEFHNLRYINVVAFILPLAILIPILIPSEKNRFNYPKVEAELLSHQDLREIQWKNRGFIPDRPIARLCGKVRYIGRGFEFSERGLSPATRNDKCVVAKIYVDESDENTPLGVGDVKLNFYGGNFPKENDYIYCEGRARTGIFRDIILDVEEWGRLNAEQ